MQLELINKLYLELSQVATAQTITELRLKEQLKELFSFIFSQDVPDANVFLRNELPLKELEALLGGELTDYQKMILSKYPNDLNSK